MSVGAGEGRPALFDERLLGRRRDRAMGRGFLGRGDFLWRAVAEMLAERLGEVSRDFPRAAVLGTGAGLVAEALGPRTGNALLLQRDPSPAMAAVASGAAPRAHTKTIAPDMLELPEGGVDLALSVFLMHALEDPVGHLVQLRRALAPDGIAIAAFFGGRTLAELRMALAEAEVEILGGLGPRISPMGEIRDLGALLQRAGFAMPVADSERFDATYGDPLALLGDLRAMGETSILAGRRPLRRDVLGRAAAIYAEHFGTPDGRVRASFEVVFLTGWAPGPDQPKALRPGSASTRLADALGTEELPAGERAPGPKS